MALMNLGFKTTVGLGLRAALIIFSFCLFICSCVTLGKLDFWEDRAGVSLVTSLLGFIYYIPTVLPFTVRYFSPAIVLAGDIWMVIWWIIALGVMGDRFGSDLTCKWVTGDYKTGCQAGKGALAFSVLGFVTSLATVAIIGYFTVYQSYKDGGKQGLLQKGSLANGAVFLDGSAAPSTAPADVEDIEAGAGAASSGQEEAIDQKDVESQPTEHSPVASRHSEDLATATK
ncbi:hypothetical protein FT663_01773 [Candidozyma haemuli var. vulneris]|uniref:MARVEL domain-containing protein n=1 Tax=Candidozyma haemuli TaxID=45357 RepID=A0A2V1ATB3_9ASCO|nr:hypothetical protein CXQ85_002317 [[Candida] haemuloni]KAF3989529.1 hypothetical protein FT662_02798 [[Candida] haemuloni var. vulneris]KAF3993784.1 hypothetical protein FT663_01773 [[Candida] haemuloni var. vulneris]PVH20523.1 hypothetical protein CXQ85_002317 [[Candida] haemuloni]